MKTLTTDSIKKNGWLIFEVVSGSKSYGLDNELSDTDIKGVFVLPKESFYGLEYTAQVNNESNDVMYYELRRFIELLSKNNPNITEMLNVPAGCILLKHSVMEMVSMEMFLSKRCEQSFANYAFTQIRKAYGLEKKIMQSIEEHRKSVEDFCYVYEGEQAIELKPWLRGKAFAQSEIGLSAFAHLRDCYNIFQSAAIPYAGIVKKDNANEVSLSCIPKGEESIGLLYFNRDGYSVYCKQYKEYWEWVNKRNDARYTATMLHGKRYDAKNMMDVFRLLRMAKEIATHGTVNVHRDDRTFLLDIKSGKFEYDYLVEKATGLKDELPELYRESALPEHPNMEAVNQLLINMRKRYYTENM